MSKFKVNDRIKVIVNYPSDGCMEVGAEGIVRGVEEDDFEPGTYNYAVEFLTSEYGGHDCEGLCADGKGWYLSEDEIELSDNVRILVFDNYELKSYQRALKDVIDEIHMNDLYQEDREILLDLLGKLS
ncbi:MAG: hypothetical protein WDA59_00135 [Methanofastidiosum sp.]